MHSKRGKIIGAALLLCCAFTQLGACRVGNLEIRVEKNELTSYKNVFQINDEKYPVEIAKLYLCNYQNLYGRTNGLDLWENTDTADLETYVKSVTIQELSRIVCMDLLAEEKGLELSEKEQKLAGKAAEEYYESLTEAELSFMEISLKQVQQAYEDYALANKLYEVLTEDTQEEVSDDEARVIRLLEIYVTDEKSAAAVEKELKAGTDFRTVAETYNLSGESERTVARGEYPQQIEDIAFNLDNDALSGRIETEDGYYFLKCLNKFEEELTQSNKEKIRIRREKEKFEDSYQGFVDEADFRMNDHLWDKISLSDTQEIQTDSFFRVYDRYLRRNTEDGMGI